MGVMDRIPTEHNPATRSPYVSGPPRPPSIQPTHQGIRCRFWPFQRR